MFLNKEEIKTWLPHREPFLFIDAIESVERPLSKSRRDTTEVSMKSLLGTKVIASYRTRPEHPIFEGHFPNGPILPGVIQVEMMAQTSIFCLIELHPLVITRPIEVALLSLENAKFRKPIYPDMILRIESECKMARGNFITHQCKIYCKDSLCSEATCMALVKNK